MGEILETIGDVRVRVELDTAPDEPYDDGSSPLLALTYGASGFQAEQVAKVTSFVVPDEIVAALTNWGGDPDKFERYLRIFHGTRNVVWYESGWSCYVTFDTAAWREAMGLTDEVVAERAASGEPVCLADMSEWRAYVEGDVYFYVVEKRTMWDARDSDAEMETWEEVDSISGFYGREYAEEAAKEALAGRVSE